jgi:DNA-binding transcriptional ArsR family regulator
METNAVLDALAALSQATRLAIFRHLVEAGPDGATVGSIADAHGLAAATLSFHLKELTRAQLLVSRQEGRFIRYAANFDTMNGLIGYLTENCCGGNPELCGPSCASTKRPSKTLRKRNAK